MAEPALKLDVFYGISSPWAYFGAPRAVDVARTHGAEIVLRPIRIIEANGGIPLRSRPDAGRPIMLWNWTDGGVISIWRST